MLKEKFELENANKNVKFVYSGKVPEATKDLIDEKELSTNLSERELMVSIDYSNTPATKVQYNTENDVFYLKIGPVPQNFDVNRIKSKVTGFDFDLIITIGAQELADLGPIYNNLRYEINQGKKINVDITNKNTRFGIVNVIDDKSDSLSELVLKNATEWELSVTKKAAKALLTGITYKDNGKKS